MIGYLTDLSELTPERKIEFLRRWVLVNSILYYEFDFTMHSDRIFDERAKQLVTLQKNYYEMSKSIELYDVFKDFDGTTGFDLYHRLTQEDKNYFANYAMHCKLLTERRNKKF